MADIIYFRQPKLITRFEDFLDELVEAGIDTLTLAHDMGDISFFRDTDAVRARSLLKDRGIATPAMHGAFRDGFDLNHPDSKEMIESHIALLGNVAELGVKTYVLHAGLPVDGRSDTEEWNAVRRSLEQLVPFARSLDMILALENLPPNYVGHRPENLMAIVDDFSSPHLRLCFDSGHANMCGDAVAYLNAISSHVVTMHLHDNDGNGDQHLSPGEGTMDWDALATMIRSYPNLMHIEIESFNREGFSHAELLAIYREILG